MSIIGTVESLWRYPVKSMRGAALSEAFVGFAGVYGDRLFAFREPRTMTVFSMRSAADADWRTIL
jgi:uncharacterized protein YcbX